MNGLVKPLGLGPTRSTVWGLTSNDFESHRMTSEPSRAADEDAHRIREERQDKIMQSMVQKIEELVQEQQLLQAKVAELTSSTGSRQVPDAFSDLETHADQPTVHSSSSNHPVPSRGRHAMKRGKTHHMSGDWVGCNVRLKSFNIQKVTVARGTIVSDRPHTKVGGVELGPEFLEMRSELLVRPHGRFKKIGDAVGASIAWPSILVENIEG